MLNLSNGLAENMLNDYVFKLKGIPPPYFKKSTNYIKDMELVLIYFEEKHRQLGGKDKQKA